MKADVDWIWKVNLLSRALWGRKTISGQECLAICRAVAIGMMAANMPKANADYAMVKATPYDPTDFNPATFNLGDGFQKPSSFANCATSARSVRSELIFLSLKGTISAMPQSKTLVSSGQSDCVGFCKPSFMPLKRTYHGLYGQRPMQSSA
jgi:hypothetical protein